MLFSRGTVNHQKNIDALKKYPERGVLFEGTFSSPPCLDKNLISKMELRPICEFILSVSKSRKSFMRLMKYTKQSPIVYESDEEYNSLFQNLNIALNSENFASKEKSILG